MVVARVHYKLLVEHSVTDANYCPDYYPRYIYMEKVARECSCIWCYGQ